MAVVKNLATVMTTASITSSTTTIPVNRTNVFGASQNPLDDPFYATIMPADASEPANLTNSEIVLVTGISGSNLIVTRAQRDTTARAFNSGAIVSNGIYADDAVLLGEAGTAVNPQPWVRPADIVWSEMVDRIYPVGSIYMSAFIASPLDVGNLLGGTWVHWGAGRVPIGVDDTDTDFNGAELTGGEKTHTLTVAEMPSHTHTQNPHGHRARYAQNMASGSVNHGPNSTGSNWKAANTWIENTTATNQNTGGGGAHNNLQPYITCYMFKRTA